MNRVLFFLFFSIPFFSFAEDIEIDLDNKEETKVIVKDSDNNKRNEDNPVHVEEKYFEPTIESYQYWTERGGMQVIDTTLSIEKYYKNRRYNHKDDFGTMPFSNIGQGANPLLYTSDIKEPINMTPEVKSFNLLNAEEVKYYDVKTPTTEFTYNNPYKRGYSLSTLFTHNPNAYWNYSVQYNGLRSVGKYLDELSESNSFLGTLSHHSKDNKYKLWSHFLVETFRNEENGGIKNLEDFEGPNDITNRDRMEVNLRGSMSQFQRRRFYLGQEYNFLKTDKSGTEHAIGLRNIFEYETSHYFYREKKENSYYDTPYIEELANRYNKKSLKRLTNTLSAFYKLSERVDIGVGMKYENDHFYYDRILSVNEDKFKSLNDNRIGGVFKVGYNDKYVRFLSEGQIMSGDTFGGSSYIDNTLEFTPLKGYSIEANLGVKSQIPSLNLVYNQSFYQDFNYILGDVQNEKTVKFGGTLKLKPFKTKISANLYNISSYTYLDANYKPQQANSPVNLYQLGIQNQFDFWKLHLNTNMVYQHVTDNADVLPLPKFVGRATLYYQSKVFSGNAEMQLGVSGYYFSKFKSREFFPVTNEFKLAGEGTNYNIGEYPVFDVFLHMKVKRMTFILEGQHFNSTLGDKNYYSAPRKPFSDFRLNMGILWYLFN